MERAAGGAGRFKLRGFTVASWLWWWFIIKAVVAQTQNVTEEVWSQFPAYMARTTPPLCTQGVQVTRRFWKLLEDIRAKSSWHQRCFAQHKGQYVAPFTKGHIDLRQSGEQG
ncbi:hypothetical protein Hdeb2414_s0012g00392401 [Helianthus debilis subsp. tardiflorus]